jgi:hypothetical protein
MSSASRSLWILGGLVLLAVFVAACSDSSTGGRKGHPDVALRDRLGNNLDAFSSEPYSPRQTCGPCHDFEMITNAYHFEQGRTNLEGEIVMKDDYFDDGRYFLLSAGMYGKW